MAVGTTNFPTSLDDSVSLPIPENNASSTLTNPINDTVLLLTIDDPDEFPDAGEFTLVDSLTAPTKRENVIIESRSGADFIIEPAGRGAGGTTAQNWDAGAFIQCRPTKLYYTALRSAIEAIENKLGTGNLIDASQLADGSISNAELQYLDGVTSSIQNQINAKQAAFTSQSANVVYAGPASGGAAAPAFRSLVAADIPNLSASYSVVGHNHSGVYQPIDQDLTDIAALTGDGLLRRSSNIWAMDSAAYLTANQTITLSGDVSGSGATSISVAIGAGKVTNNMLAGSIAISKLSITGTPDGTKFLRDDGSWATASGGGLTVGTTTIASGTAGRILYETSGNVVGEIAGSSVTANGAISFAPTARTSGNPALPFAQFLSAADTGLSNVEQIAFQIGGDASQATVTRTWSGGGGAIATQRNVLIVAPTLAASAAQTFTEASTLTVSGNPAAGPNVTIGRAFAIRVPVAGGAIKVGDTTSSLSNSVSSSNSYIEAVGGSTSVAIGTVNVSGSAYGGISGNTGGFGGGAAIGFTFNGQIQFGAPTISGKTYGRWTEDGLAVGHVVFVTTSAQLHAVSNEATRVGFRVDSAATPSADIARFTVNGTTTAGAYTGVAKGGTVFTPRATYTGTTSSTALNLANGNFQTFTFGAGNETITLSNIPNSAYIIIAMIQDGTGSRTATWPSAIKWVGGAAPTLTTTAGARDVFIFSADGTNLYEIARALDVK